MGARIQILLVAYVVLSASAFSVSNIHVPFLPSIPGFLKGTGVKRAQQPLQDGLNEWIQWEEAKALEKLLDNIAPGGRGLEGVVNGSVIASPSREHPDYFYQWVRDAAITISTLVDIYADNPLFGDSKRIPDILDAYATLQSTIQHTHNPSGTFQDLNGLGEPKFEVDGSAFAGSWGRPQRDGPALRATTLMSYIRAYNASHPSLWSTDQGKSWFARFYQATLPANSIIKADLEYVSHSWNQTGFDLWEEVDGLHFFTAIVQLRALHEGSEIATAFGDLGAAKWYAMQAEYLEIFVKRFWHDKKGHLVETLDSQRSGLDCGILLGALHGSPSRGSPSTISYTSYSDEILVSLLAFIQDQRTRFPINVARSPASNSQILSGTGLGRYPEDIYDGYGNDPKRGGNPWFLCTSSAAEILYRTASHLITTSQLTITKLNYPFYKALVSPLALDVRVDTTYGPGNTEFALVIERLKTLGDGFLGVVKTHTSSEGTMSEQFDRETGLERGARDLTWSYGAFLQAVRAKKAVI
ncbi:glycoside hydrolase family 15 protein [Aaosphaeria arxii CBS 175.79]|uniref:glucan 1,4-alpha-glucosidase n=1 Tax=Aaosphaeria arxii CBS 175.79 TaxID=1450172 RepID=A0A6A5Y3F6_9PLEO|nr:glycoside hydrolase family 15 protein [Aaosphaeria arxii CBS 175.79]KAF2019998.1 glycoside hydrolase family 15 protein [Aaosphaeria arxii CBS 175.79]